MQKREYNTARVIAMLLVVFGHAQIFSFGNAAWVFPVNSFRNGMDRLISFLYCFHVQLFFFVSGALFSTSKNANAACGSVQYVKKKARRLLLPYFLCFVLLLLPARMMVGFYADGFPACLKQILIDISGFGNNGHLWFLPTLFVISMVFYVLERAMRGRMLPLAAVCTAIYGITLFIPDRYDICFRYMIWYVSGFFFDRLGYQKLRDWSNQMRWMLFAICGLCSVLLYKVCSVLQGMPALAVSIAVTAFGIAGVLCIAFFLAEHRNQPLQFLEKQSYSIYLYHDPVNYLFLFIFGNIISFSSLNEKTYILVIIMKILASLLGALAISFGMQSAKKLFSRTIQK